jgi:hypothetical protein
MFDVRLHVRHSLNGQGARANDSYAVVLPLLALRILGPGSGTDDTTYEAIDAFDAGLFVVVQEACRVEEKIAFLLELLLLARRCRLT